MRVILPLYAAIPEQYVSQMKLECEFEVELCWRRQYCGIKSLEYQGVTFYFVDNQYYFGRSYIYGLGGDEYERFGFFDRAVIDALVHLDFKPDVIHCHDWQTGMIPALLKIQYAQFPFYQDMKTVYTIHNLQYQGVFPIKAVQDTLGLGDGLFTSDKLECYGCANYMKAGLVYADELTTVSPSYADEIQTAFYGERLDGLLRARKDQLVRHPQRHRRERLRSGEGSADLRELRSVSPRRQGNLQGGAAKGARPDGGPDRSAGWHHFPPVQPEGLRPHRVRHPRTDGDGHSARRARHGRSEIHQPVLAGRRASIRGGWRRALR